MNQTIFERLYKKYFSDTCPPQPDGVPKDKQLGCFNALNNYGKDPDPDNCRECWRQCLKEVVRND